MTSPQPIYTSRGGCAAFVVGLYLFDSGGQWIGFREGRDVYLINGEYVGYLSDDRRVLRPRSVPDRPRKKLPPRPDSPRIPVNVPLAPQMRELPYSIMDVFDEAPELITRALDLRPDLE